LTKAVKVGIVEAHEITKNGFTFVVYSEYDIIVGLAKRKFVKLAEADLETRFG
jgi:hypothetical protein